MFSILRIHFSIKFLRNSLIQLTVLVSSKFALDHLYTVSQFSLYSHSADASLPLQKNISTFFLSDFISSKIGNHNVAIIIFKSSKKLKAKSCSDSFSLDCVGLVLFMSEHLFILLDSLQQ